jgi:pimeloyl-ACP methyl ester carboxylesterase
VLETGPTVTREAVVFVHGNPGCARDWAGLLPQTAEVARSIALDLPGYGGADKPDDFDFTVGGYAKHLAGAIDRLGVERVHLVAHDFGGPFALLWLLSHADRARSLTLIDTGVLPGYRWHRAARIWRTPVVGELAQKSLNRPVFEAAMRRDNPRPLPTEFVDLCYANLKRMGSAVPKLYRSTDVKLIEAVIPTLHVIWGRHDPYIGAEYAQRQREAFPNAEVVVLEESGHWPFIDAPEEVSRELVRFLAKQVARTQRSPESRL